MITADEARAALDSDDERLLVIEQRKKAFEKSVRRALDEGKSKVIGLWTSAYYDGLYLGRSTGRKFNIAEEMTEWVEKLGYKVTRQRGVGGLPGRESWTYYIHW